MPPPTDFGRILAAFCLTHQLVGLLLMKMRDSSTLKKLSSSQLSPHRRPFDILCSICVHWFRTLAKKMNNCSLHHFTAANISWNVLQWHFRQPPCPWLKLEMPDFSTPPPVWGLRETRGDGDGPIRLPDHVLLLAPYWKMWYISLWLGLAAGALWPNRGRRFFPNLFDPSSGGWGGHGGGSGMGLFHSPPMSSYYLPIGAYGLSLTVLGLFTWLQKRFRPSIRPGYDHKYRSRSYRLSSGN